METALLNSIDLSNLFGITKERARKMSRVELRSILFSIRQFKLLLEHRISELDDEHDEAEHLSEQLDQLSGLVEKRINADLEILGNVEEVRPKLRVNALRTIAKRTPK
jgi:hypothetical protein